MKSKLSKGEHAELEALKSSSIISWKHGRPPKLDELFYDWCRQTRSPYVRIAWGRRYADVFFEMPTSSGLLDEQGKRRLWALMPEGCRQPGEDIVGIPNEKVDAFAAKIVEIGRDFCKRCPA
jgi:hypothetical protein